MLIYATCARESDGKDTLKNVKISDLRYFFLCCRVKIYYLCNCNNKVEYKKVTII